MLINPDTVRRRGAIAVLAAICLFSLAALHPAIAAKNGTERQKTRITSDSVVYAGGNETIVFRDNVHVQRSDFRLWCEKMTVHLSDAGQQKGREGSRAQDFEKIVAEDNVRLRMDNRNATCRKAVYRSDAEVITLLGNVRLRQGRNRVQGQKVRMDLARNTTEVMGSEESQVEATFYNQNSTGLSDGGLEGN